MYKLIYAFYGITFNFATNNSIVCFDLFFGESVAEITEIKDVFYFRGI